ncbi:AP-4 complex subunit epsilon-1-like isoform X2 [Cloeon dipterum]|uniref:AP-4 complex subunit epsilon-1-like isoform X2 n=1 Tax=Cloeon dipterum TaxID=197152 RepID=UPI00321FE8D7
MMSNILEKTLGSVLSSTDQFAGLRVVYQKCLAARTKQEEEKLIKQLLETVKIRLANPSTRPLLAGHCLAFAVFVNLMGYNVDFAHIHAINLAQQTSYVEKKMGYVACCCLLNEKNELSLLLVNTLCRDLGSNNVAVVGLAISALCSAPIPRDAVPALLPALLDRLHHPKAYIRCRAVVAAHHLLRQHPDLCDLGSVVSLLGDEDPHVVHRLLSCLPDIIEKSPEAVSGLVHPLVAIQRQILNGKLPPDMTYRGLPAPWMQLSILKCLPELCLTEEEEFASREVLLETIKACSPKNVVISDPPIRAAINSRALAALLSLEEPNEASRLRIMHFAGTFMQSGNGDTKNEGLLLLESALVKYQIALTPEQLAIIKLSLEHEDISIRRRAFGLLSASATEKDVQNVCGQLFTQAVSPKTDEVLKQWLLEQALQLMDRYPVALTDDWKLSAVIKLMPLAEDIKIGKELMKNAKNILLKGCIKEETHVKMLTVLTMHSESKKAPTSLLKLYIWTLGNFPNKLSQGEALSRLLTLGNKLLSNAKTEKSTDELLLLTISSLRNVIDSGNFNSLDGLKDFLKEASEYSPMHMLEACELINSLPHLRQISSCLKDVDIDFSLGLLDKFVLKSIETQNGRIYQPQVATQILQSKTSSSPDLAHLLPVVLPQSPSPIMHLSQESFNTSDESSSAKSVCYYSQNLESACPETVKSNLWTKEGRLGHEADKSTSAEPLVKALGISGMKNLEGEPSASNEDPLGDLLS